MDLQQLHQTFDACLSPENEVRAAAEKRLTEIERFPGFSNALLQYCTSATEAHVKLASVYLKNTVLKHWQQVDMMDDNWVIGEEDKAMLRQSIVSAVIFSPLSVQKIFAVAFRRMVSATFLQDFPGITELLIEHLAAEQFAVRRGTLVALQSICKKLRVKSDDATPINAFIAQIQPKLWQLVLSTQEPTAENLTLHHYVMKVYMALTLFHYPPALLDVTAMNNWLNMFTSLLAMNVGEMEGEKETWPELPVWKVKKWCLKIINDIFVRFGIPTNCEKKTRPFSIALNENNWNTRCLEIVQAQLVSFSQGQYLPPKVLRGCIAFITDALESAKTWKMLKPYTLQLVEHVMFPLLCHSDTREELWEEDPYEYIRLQYDLMQEFVSAESAAALFMAALTRLRGKQTFDALVEFLMAKLQANAQASPTRDPRLQFGALSILGIVAPTLVVKKKFKQQLESLLATYVLPELAAEQGFLRMQAAEVLSKFTSEDRTDAFALHVAEQILFRLTDPETRVSLAAALAIRRYIEDFQCVRKAMEPHLKTIMQVMLKLVRESDNEDLTDVMTRFIEIYGPLMAPYALEMAVEMLNTFRRLVDTCNPDDENEAHKMLAAESILEAVRSLVSLFAMHSPENQEPFDQAIAPVLKTIIVDGHHDFIDEALALIACVTQTRITDVMYPAIEWMHTAFQTHSFDFFQEMLHPISNFLDNGADRIRQDETMRAYLFSFARTTWAKSSMEDSLWHATKLMEMLVAADLISVPDMQSAVGMICTRLMTEPHFEQPFIISACLGFIAVAIFFKPLEVLGALESIPMANGMPLTVGFFQTYASNIAHCRGLHNRRMGILGLTRLLSLTSQQHPQAMHSIYPQITAILLTLFEKLPEAYEANSYESDDDEDDGSKIELSLDQLGRLANMDEEHPDNIDDEQDATEESLDDMLEGMREAIGMQGNTEADEGFFGAFTTILDDNERFDEYIFFSQTLQELQRTDAALYSSVITSSQQTAPQMLEQIAAVAAKHQAEASKSPPKSA